MLRRVMIPLLALTPTAASAQFCAGHEPSVAQNGRVYGHLPYGDAPAEELVSAPEGFAVGQPCLVRRDMLPDLLRLIDASRADPMTMGQLRGLSCHRSVARQTDVFCRGATADAADRAISVAPPGYSEHATGYALDFAVRPANGCPDAEACMAATPAARWLMRNAPRFGFEQSFPVGSTQNVKWEPWHWRWVGTSWRAPGAMQARAVFAKARATFPARPGVDTLTVRVAAQPPVPPAPVVLGKQKRKRR